MTTVKDYWDLYSQQSSLMVARDGAKKGPDDFNVPPPFLWHYGEFADDGRTSLQGLHSTEASPSWQAEQSALPAWERGNPPAWEYGTPGYNWGKPDYPWTRNVQSVPKGLFPALYGLGLLINPASGTTGPVDPAVETVQTELARLGFLYNERSPEGIDGRWGSRTRLALRFAADYLGWTEPTYREVAGGIEIPDAFLDALRRGIPAGASVPGRVSAPATQQSSSNSEGMSTGTMVLLLAAAGAGLYFATRRSEPARPVQAWLVPKGQGTDLVRARPSGMVVTPGRSDVVRF